MLYIFILLTIVLSLVWGHTMWVAFKSLRENFSFPIFLSITFTGFATLVLILVFIIKIKGVIL